MRRNILFITSCAVLLIAAVSLGFALRTVKALTPDGVWKDVNSDYYIVFYGDTYVETTYNVRRGFARVDGGIVMTDAGGNSYFVELAENCGGHAIVHLNGEVHTMRRATEHESANPYLYRWGSDVSGKCIGAYSLKQELSLNYFLRLYESNQFTSVVDDEETTGKYAIAPDGNILLFTEEGTRIDSLHRWTSGAAFGEMTSSLKLTEEWLSPVELLGYELNGIIKDTQLGTTYSFNADSICIRTQLDGSETEFLYFMSPDGLITLTDSAGSGVMDYIWYDITYNMAYRYVLDTDDWFAYLHGDLVPDIFSAQNKVTDSNTDTADLDPTAGNGDMTTSFRGQGTASSSDESKHYFADDNKEGESESAEDESAEAGSSSDEGSNILDPGVIAGIMEGGV